MNDNFTIGEIAEELILQDEKSKSTKFKNIDILEGLGSNNSEHIIDISDVELPDKFVHDLCEATTVGMIGVNIAKQESIPKVKKSKLKKKKLRKIKRVIKKESYNSKFERIIREQFGLC